MPRKKKQQEVIDVPSCSSCMFNKDGDCRRMPPIFVNDGEQCGFTWPPVEPDEWCGEHKRVLQ